MDNELIFEGKKYISSKRAAEITGYAKDYIGQLCRGEKIDCRMVGRGWYVEENAIKNYNGYEQAQGKVGKTEEGYSRLNPTITILSGEAPSAVSLSDSSEVREETLSTFSTTPTERVSNKVTINVRRGDADAIIEKKPIHKEISSKRDIAEIHPNHNHNHNHNHILDAGGSITYFPDTSPLVPETSRAHKLVKGARMPSMPAAFNNRSFDLGIKNKKTVEYPLVFSPVRVHSNDISVVEEYTRTSRGVFKRPVTYFAFALVFVGLIFSAIYTTKDTFSVFQEMNDQIELFFNGAFGFFDGLNTVEYEAKGN